MTTKKKLTPQQKLSWLKNNKIITKEKPSQSTINRLYSFYHRNPINTPLYVAYGLQKRIDKRLDQYGADYKMQTPKGRITAKKYMQDTVKQRFKNVNRKLSYQTTFTHSKYKKYMHRVQDYLVYRPNITANDENIDRAMKKIQTQLLPVIRKDVDLVAKNFNMFYKTALIGAVSSFKSHDFPQGLGYNYQRLGFIRLYEKQYRKYLDFFIDELFNTIRNGLRLVYEYDKMQVTLFKIELIFTSDKKASMYEKLRVD